MDQLILQKIISILVSMASIVSGIGSLSGTPTGLQAVGSAVPSAPALYDGYLASAITKTDTSMTLSTGTLRNGQSLSGFFCFTIDVNTPSVEYVCGTASGTSVTSLSRGVDVLNPNATSSTYAFTHRRLASVSISDYPTLQFLVRRNNGVDPFESLLYYTGVSTSTIAASSTQAIPTKEYVDYVGTSGCADATETARGCAELATQLETASSTSLGATTARLVIPASVATSTYNGATAPLRVVVTQNSGTIDPNFIATSSPYTWSGNNTYSGLSTLSGGALLTASSTFTATTSIAASNVNSNAVRFNGVAYAYPSSQGAANSTLVNNGSGTLSWASSTPTFAIGQFATTTTLAQTNDNVITVGFQPRFIKLHYYVQGHTAAASTNIYVGQKGVALYSGTTLVANTVAWSGGAGGAGVQMSGDGGTVAETTSTFSSTVTSTSAPDVGTDGSGNDDIRVIMSVSAVSSTGFTIRGVTTTGTGTNTSNARIQVAYEAMN